MVVGGASGIVEVAPPLPTWAEGLLAEVQLVDGASGGFRQAIAFFLAANPISGDTFVITDGSTTRTYGFGTGGDVTVAIGAFVTITMANLVSAISGDGAGLWEAVGLSDLDALGPSTVLVIYRTAQSADSFDDRIHSAGANGTPANFQYVNYNGEADYTSDVVEDLPTSDPGEKQFGIGRAFASLTANETHAMRNEDTFHHWDSDSETWKNLLDGVVIPLDQEQVTVIPLFFSGAFPVLFTGAFQYIGGLQTAALLPLASTVPTGFKVTFVRVNSSVSALALTPAPPDTIFAPGLAAGAPLIETTAFGTVTLVTSAFSTGWLVYSRN